MREELYFPLFVDLSQKNIVVIGAGKIAARRVRSLLPFAGKIKVIAPEVSSEIAEMAASSEGVLMVEQRPFETSDLDGADMVLAITNDKDLNTQIGTLCKEKKVLVNVSHEKELCDFYFPGVVQKDNVVIGITASGKDHSEARKVTEQIRAMMEDAE
ncbi:MAG: bifunctional precorrin-2 dehydrogenase/sirohydrochlorin ferrochelatase [Lachnospiraceae bacterium]|nr:bifunctional precorrin-2 dehydrogenase/sirohydrochlorin ferrochelatase [Lachnospiraceae bacterium]